MNDIAQNFMYSGDSIAIAYISGVNDNMSQSHFHDYYELYFLDNGERYHYMDDKLTKTLTGDCIIFPPHTMHRSYSERDCAFSRIVLYFKPEVIASEEMLKRLSTSDCVYNSSPASLTILRRLMYELLELQNKTVDFKFERMNALTNLILITVLGMKQKKSGIMQKNRTTQIINYISHNYNHDISLKDLSDMLHISEYYMCREFKKNTNRTIIDYVKSTRIMNAQRLFTETDKNVTQVALLTGFSNLTHFNRVFKEITGLSPSEYRKLHKNC